MRKEVLLIRTNTENGAISFAMMVLVLDLNLVSGKLPFLRNGERSHLLSIVKKEMGDSLKFKIFLETENSIYYFF